MLRLLRTILALWVLVVLQTTLVPSMRLLDAVPDLPLLLVVLVALREGAAGGALAGFAAGLFVDLNSPRGLGLTSLVNSLVGFGVGFLSDRLVRGSPPARIAVVFLAVLVRDLGIVMATSADEIGRLFVRGVLPGALYSALLAVPVMAVLERVLGPEEEEGQRRGR